jgi:citrate lyase subunit beta / citryl-CoA lyase
MSRLWREKPGRSGACAIVNGILPPDDNELRRARDIVAAFEAARAAGLARAELEGSLIELPTYANAKRLIARAEAMRQFERGGG